MLRRAALVLIAGSLVALAGCRSAPVYNIVEAPVMSPRGASMQEVERAILQAGAALGWQMVSNRPGHMVGTLLLRDHRAIVDIDYTPKVYSIRYRDSSGLDYGGGQIHKNYNGWIQNLDREIRTRLAAA
ncbi:MAG TPA: hypothetical protein VNG69_17565 [Casimicrobiaceae bacterium]|nr:hypothetical protein [Casimicrobiaceae bacterium]